MPQLPHSIELHDSKLSAIDKIGKDVHISFSPAYVHREGKGWLQEAIIVIYEGTIEKGSPRFPVTIAEGHMQTPRRLYDNLLIIPLDTVGPIRLEMELVTGETVSIFGQGVSQGFKSEAVFVEEFPSS